MDDYHAAFSASVQVCEQERTEDGSTTLLSSGQHLRCADGLGK
jgi:hypothetical protein